MCSYIRFLRSLSSPFYPIKQHVPLTKAELDALPAESLDESIVIGTFSFHFYVPLPPLFAILTHFPLPPSLPQPRRTIVSAPSASCIPPTSRKNPSGSTCSRSYLKQVMLACLPLKSMQR